MLPKRMPKKSRKKRKIAIIAGSRGEWGYYRPIIKEIIKHPDLDYGVIATNMHVLESFGSSIEEIRKEKFKVDAVIYNTLDGYNHVTMAKSLAIFMMQLPEVLRGMGADMILTAGDRGEQLMAATVGAHLYLPVAHIQAGERSGNIDGLTRHAIGKFAHIHFASNEDAARRLIRMGEQTFRVFNVGAPQLDELIEDIATPEKELRALFKIDPSFPTILVVQHPVTEEFDLAEDAMVQTLDAVKQFKANIIIVQPNSDAGSLAIRRAVARGRTTDMIVVPNMPRAHYVGLMKMADVLVGNSSSGILEAPTYGLPAVNIGRRQEGRIRGKNVIDCPEYNSTKIAQAIKKALSPSFKKKCKGIPNPYGDGKSSQRIVKTLAEFEINEKLLVKQITY